MIEFVKHITEDTPQEKVAIIAKTECDAKKYASMFTTYKLILNENDVDLIKCKTVITTIYLSKGLEYDKIILPDLSDDNYVTELDRQNLYVAITRALHKVYGFYVGKPSVFIPKEYLTDNSVCQQKNFECGKENNIIPK